MTDADKQRIGQIYAGKDWRALARGQSGQWFAVNAMESEAAAVEEVLKACRQAEPTCELHAIGNFPHRPAHQLNMAKRLAVDHCCGVIIDVQEFFFSVAARQAAWLPRWRPTPRKLCRPARLSPNTARYHAGAAGGESEGHLAASDQPAPARQRIGAARCEKDFFDLTREEEVDDLKALEQRPRSSSPVVRPMSASWQSLPRPAEPRL